MPSSKLAKWLPGREIRIRRLERKLSQSAVGRFVVRGDQTVSKWEHFVKCPEATQMYVLAAKLGMDDELRDYMVQIAENEHEQNLRSDRRFNALCLSMAERSNGQIHKWEPIFVPGIAQTRDYHFNLLPRSQPYTAEQLNRGWSFKKSRQAALISRTDNPTMRLVIGAQALRDLGLLTEEAREEQVDRLRELDALPNWEIRIVRGPHPEGASAFDIYKPAGAEFGSPPFVYTELFDESWCIEETERIARYDGLWQLLWGKSIPLREFLND